MFHDLSDEEIIESLTAIKGVGRWTVEMVLIFCLGREDVFALDDYGIQTALVEIYRLKEEKNKAMSSKCDPVTYGSLLFSGSLAINASKTVFRQKETLNDSEQNDGWQGHHHRPRQKQRPVRAIQFLQLTQTHR